MLPKLRNDDCGRSAFDSTERNDCVVRALAAACSVPYQTAHSACAVAGRRNRCGCNFAKAVDALLFGTSAWNTVVCKLPYRVPVANVLHQLPIGGRYILRVSGHVIAVVNDVVIDINPQTQMRRFVKEVWLFTKS